MRNIPKKSELVDVIRTALDCHSHFGKIKITQKDPDDFLLGDKAIVICEQCVERMRKAIDLKDGETNLSAYGYGNNTD